MTGQIQWVVFNEKWEETVRRIRTKLIIYSHLRGILPSRVPDENDSRLPIL